jgi:ketoreductase RED2
VAIDPPAKVGGRSDAGGSAPTSPGHTHPQSTLEGQVAIVTGSSTGIGAAIARALAGAGASVIVNSSSTADEGQQVADEVGGIYVQAAIGDDGAARKLVASAVERFGRLDIVVNNAAITTVISHADLDSVTDEIFERILQVNVVGPWQMIRAAAPHMKASGHGQIINITSRSATRPSGSSVPYAVSKAAMNHMTVLLANALGPEIRVNAIAPGLIDTRWSKDWSELHERVRTQAPLRRVGLPEDVAQALMGLVAARYVTGQVLHVDGGT